MDRDQEAFNGNAVPPDPQTEQALHELAHQFGGAEEFLTGMDEIRADLHEAEEGFAIDVDEGAWGTIAVRPGSLTIARGDGQVFELQWNDAYRLLGRELGEA